MKSGVLILTTSFCLFLSNMVFPQTGESKFKMVIINQNEKKVIPLYPSFRIDSLSFTDSNKDRELDGKEYGFISFYIKNTGTILLKELNVSLDIPEGSEGISFNKSQPVRQIDVGDSTLVKIPVSADDKLRNGEAQFKIFITDNNSDSMKTAQLLIPTRELVLPPEFTWIAPDITSGEADFPVVEVTGIVKTKSNLTGLNIYINGVIPDDNTAFEVLPTENQDGYSLKRSVRLNEGSNEIRIEAENVSGKIVSDPRIINYQVQKIDETYVEKRLALVIGNANYKSVRALPNPINDAKDISAALEEIGFKVLKYFDADFKTMKKAEDDFGDILRDYNIGLFYYAGHGVQVNGRNYLIPVDAVLKVEQDVDDDCIEVGRLIGKMDAALTNTNIIILDACRDNPFIKSWNTSRGTGQEDNVGLAPIIAPTGTYIAFAADANQTASDGTGKNSLYTEAILKFIKVPGIPIEEFFKRVRAEVLVKSNKKQVPAEYSKLIGDFYFIRK